MPASFFSQVGDYAIRGRIIDKDGSYSVYSTIITVSEAQSLKVTTTQDVVGQDGVTSLREAVNLANSNADLSAITFDETVFSTAKTLTVMSGFALTQNVAITGPAAGVTIDGVNDSLDNFTVFSTVDFSGLTIQNGGNAIYNHSGTVTVTDCIVSSNMYGIYNSYDRTVTLTSSTLSSNSYGIYSDGTATITSSTSSGNHYGFYNDGTATVTASTFSDNTTGLYNSYDAPLILTNSTLSGNIGGFYTESAATINSSTLSGNDFGLEAFGTVTLHNTIVAGNASGNYFGDIVADSHNVLSGDPKLGPLQDNGGPTQTMALLYGSPALNAGDDAAAPATDQRGLPRPVGISDIGAFEVQATYLIRGYVRTSDLSPVPNVSVQLSTATGAAGAPVTTDATGYFEFSGVPAGTYTVTASKTGWSFSPNPVSLTVTTGNRGVNFKATRVVSVHMVRGRIADFYRCRSARCERGADTSQRRRDQSGAHQRRRLLHLHQCACRQLHPHTELERLPLHPTRTQHRGH